MTVQLLNNGTNVLVPPTYSAPPVVPYAGRLVVMTQDYVSTTTLWSPIESIVFTTSLLPVQNEQQAPPNREGSKNIGISTTTAQSQFQPIITDIAIDHRNGNASANRQQIYYLPTAEYRMADFQSSKTAIRSIDIKVFWKNRLDNQLYPMSMYNLSSVSIKLMFRRKNAAPKSERNY
jgi:hypothetical protein